MSAFRTDGRGRGGASLYRLTACIPFKSVKNKSKNERQMVETIFLHAILDQRTGVGGWQPQSES